MDAYDAGDEEESIRIATCLRVLFHAKGRNTSIMMHLGLEDMTMLSSSRGYGDWKDFLSHRLDLSSPQPITMQPLRGDEFNMMPLAQWWEGEPVFVHVGKGYTRKDIALACAERDGGTHVDKVLDEYYETLAEGEYAISIAGDLTFDGPAPFPQGVTIYPKNAHFALLRQFGHEVQNTFAALATSP